MHDFPVSRRHFLVGSAALAGATALFGLDTDDIDSAAPRGKERNLLSQACSPETLKEKLILRDKYRPFPTVHDRGAWEGLRAETGASLLAGGEKYLKYEWPEMPATVFLEYARNGNRTDYENLWNARMRALQSLVFAECVENKGRFLDDIVNGLWATCEESFWGVPAHLYIQKADLGLPDPRDPIVDLFAAQTSALIGYHGVSVGVGTGYRFPFGAGTGLLRDREAHPGASAGAELHVDGFAGGQAPARPSLD